MELALDPGVRRQLRLIPPEGERPGATLAVQVHGEPIPGGLVLLARYHDDRTGTPAYNAFCCLRPGRYAYEVRAESGLRAEGSFEVQADSGYLAVEIALER